MWRNAFLAYVQGIISVDEWSLDDPMKQLVFDPEQPWQFESNTVGFLPPLTNIDINLDNPKEARQRCTQELFVLVRFNRNLKYHEIPLNKIEGMWTTVGALVAANWNKILPAEIQAARGITSIQTAAREYPITVNPVGEKDSDWIVTLSWSWHVNWLVDLEEGEISNPYTINAVRGSVFRSHLLDFQDKILDFNGLFAPRPDTPLTTSLDVKATPSVVEYGQEVQIDITRARPNEQLNITFASLEQSFTVYALSTSQGRFTGVFSLSPGTYLVSVLGKLSGLQGFTEVIANHEPAPIPLVITTTPNPVITTQSYNLSVSGLVPNEYFELFFGDANQTYPDPVIARANGSSAYTASKIAGVPGVYKYKAVGINSTRTGEKTNVTSIYDPNIPLVITFTPNPVAEGLQTTLKITGAVPHETLALAGNVSTTVSADSNGVVTLVLNYPIGVYPITALGLISGRSGSGQLVVNPAVPTSLFAEITSFDGLNFTVKVVDASPSETITWHAAPFPIASWESSFTWLGTTPANAQGVAYYYGFLGQLGSFYWVFKGDSSGRVSNVVNISRTT